MEDATVRRVLEIVEASRVPVVCSQGGVIPDLVGRLASAAGLDLGSVESKKGSVWALFFADSRLVAADYVRVP
jgi:8-oxo-dGTP diphosphatase